MRAYLGKLTAFHQERAVTRAETPIGLARGSQADRFLAMVAEERYRYHSATVEVTA